MVALACLMILTACSSSPQPAQPGNLTPTAPPEITALSSASMSTQSISTPTATPASQALVSCKAPAILTPSQTEGPYFKAGSPERSSLIDSGMPGTTIVISGSVVTSDCEPVAGVELDFWQADANGVYDNTGYTLRGHQFTDTAGHYQLTTVIPGEYPGRTEHIHVKVRTSGGKELTTQLYFPDVAANTTDSIYQPELLLEITSSENPVAANFTFVIAP